MNRAPPQTALPARVAPGISSAINSRPESYMIKPLSLFLCIATAMSAQSSPGWKELFDGKSLNGWTPAESKTTWKVVDGLLTAGGPRSHLFYSGPVLNSDFRNFELEVEAKATHGTNSGVYFHTQYQAKGWPEQ